MAEVPIINHSMDAALALEPSQIVVTAANAHVKAVQQVKNFPVPARMAVGISTWKSRYHKNCPASVS